MAVMEFHLYGESCTLEELTGVSLSMEEFQLSILLQGITLLLKTENGLVRTQMTPELAAIALDPNGGMYTYTVLVRLL